jgi:tryptophan-rich sensory protein
MRRNAAVKFGVSLAICMLAGYVNSFFVLPQIPTWFSGLEKPAFVPPDIYFVPIGLLVYALFGCILFMIWKADVQNSHDKTFCLSLFVLSLILNTGWCYLFFAIKSPFIGLMISVLTVALLIAAMVQALKVSFGASLLLSPLVIIIFLITYVNYVIVMFNPTLTMVPL